MKEERERAAAPPPRVVDLSLRRERALLVGIRTAEQAVYEADESLAELEQLVRTAGGEPVGTFKQRVARPRAGTFVGKGKAAQLGERVAQGGVDVVVFDADLSPRQVWTLVQRIGCKVLDRTEVILDIFAERARTHQAKVQVELAQLQYMAGRLKRMWSHLERLGGGIGTRGPGESQLETDRRLIKKRITDLRRELAEIEERKQREVAGRTAMAYTVGLVGYTNAGKSSLLNRLTAADERVSPQMFETLETRTRRWPLGGGLEALLSDTVGFINNLPHNLVASFHATLAEAAGAALLLHVIDASHPEAILKIRAVEAVLAELGMKDSPVLAVFNKCDRVGDRSELARLAEHYPEHVQVSALTGEGIPELVAAVRPRLLERMVRLDRVVPWKDGKLLAFLEERGKALEREHGPEGVRIRGWLWPQDADVLRRMEQG